MKSHDSKVMSLYEFWQLQPTAETNDEYIASIKDYYAQLKSPYITAQNSIRHRLQAENERLRACPDGIRPLDGQMQKKAGSAEKNENFTFEIDEMESGLNWATTKIMELDREMENKILQGPARHHTLVVMQNNDAEAATPKQKGQAEKAAAAGFKHA